ncbi:tetratricopeptide repeat protein [Streptomyces sp. NPDC059452]|uniref:tetratricopeptide repeat protein n=1 Tax=Streptomyces sp. NPDC059452 TaxID=3346835 RepID=UPI0036B79F95
MTSRWPRRGGRAEEPLAPPHLRIGDGGVGAGRDISHNAFGTGSQVFDQRQYHQHQHVQGEARPVEWPLEIGRVPPLASAFQPRTALRKRIDAVRSAEAPAAQVLTGSGGVGKSQLAASYAAEAVRTGTDLVLWAPASDVHQVIAAYARAAVLVGAPGVEGAHPDADARAFLSWLATTSRSWLVVLDDVTDPAGMAEWWPPQSRGGPGRTLATTRLYDAQLTGAGRRRIDVDVYSPQEARDYLSGRLHADGCDHLLDGAADDLTRELGCLPLALGHAAAYMINQALPCAAYLDRFGESDRRLDQLLPPEADTEGYGRQVAAALLLSLDAAQRSEPQGLAAPALSLIALLDPAGHPHALWGSIGVLLHLTQARGSAYGKRRWWRKAEPPALVTGEEAHATLRTLHRYGLITSDLRDEPRAVRCHALTGRAVRETLVADHGDSPASAAAMALLTAWPDAGEDSPDLEAALRSNTAALARNAGDGLWGPLGLPALDRAGESLVALHHASESIAYHEWLIPQHERLLGAGRASTRTARDRLALAYRQAGRNREAVALEERNLAYTESELGWEHPDTLASGARLALSRRLARLHEDAEVLERRVVVGIERLRDSPDPAVMYARSLIARCHELAGRVGEGIALVEQLLTEYEQRLGREHRYTLLMRSTLAARYGKAERSDEAIALQRQVLASFERSVGPDHSDAVQAKADLADRYRDAGRTDEALALREQIVAVREDCLGPEHFLTLNARCHFADALGRAGRVVEAVALLEEILPVQERALGPKHLDTMFTRILVQRLRGGDLDELRREFLEVFRTPLAD